MASDTQGAWSAWQVVQGEGLNDFTEIVYEKKRHLGSGGGVARISLNKPDKMNTLTMVTVDEMFRAFYDANLDPMVGVIVVAGKGKNFGAGMSGGIAFIYDEENRFKDLFNPEMVAAHPLDDPEDRNFVRELILKHVDCCGSGKGQAILDDWDTACLKFTVVRPKGTKVLKRAAAVDAQVLTSNA